MQTVRQEFANRVSELRSWTDDLGVTALGSQRSSIERDTLSRAAITILLAGAFEQHLKLLIKQFITKLNRMGIPFASLPDPVRHCHLFRGAEVLKATAMRERRQSKRDQVSPSYLDTQRVSTQLASVGLGVPYVLLWEAFAETDSNPGPEVITKVLQGLNTEKPWPTITKNAPDPFPSPGGKPSQKDKLGILENLLITKLRNLFEARNRCAHGAVDAATPALSTLHEYLSAIDAISEGLFQTLEFQISVFQKSIPQVQP